MSPFHSIEEVPESLRSFVGVPENLPPPPTDNYSWAPQDPFAKDAPNIREMMERNSAAMVAESAARNQVATNIARRERQTLKTQLAKRLSEQDNQ